MGEFLSLTRHGFRLGGHQPAKFEGWFLYYHPPICCDGCDSYIQNKECLNNCLLPSSGVKNIFQCL